MNADLPRVLSLRNLSVVYAVDRGVVEAVQDVSLDIGQEQAYGLVGESGCGKSSLAFAVMGFLAANGSISSGSIRFRGEELVGKTENELRNIWGTKISMVYQNPRLSLNPSLRVGEQIAECIREHQGVSHAASKHRAIAMIDSLNIGDAGTIARYYPHELSGGMQQRICIGMALVNSPALLILDEPTTSLDVTNEVVILELVAELQRSYRTAVLYISHDLGVIYRIADRVGVMYQGRLVEEGTRKDIFYHALHPYTRNLMQCIPQKGMPTAQMKGGPGQPIEIAATGKQGESGCPLVGHCGGANRQCVHSSPPLVRVGGEHRVACHRAQHETAVLTGSCAIPIVRRQEMDPGQPLIQARGITKIYPGGARGSRDKIKRAVDEVSLDVPQGTTVAVVGESGCGKTTLARCIIGLTPLTDGHVSFDDMDISGGVQARDARMCQRLQMVFQAPDDTLNPVYTVGQILKRPLQLHTKLRGRHLQERIDELLTRVRIPLEYTHRYPHQLSGGEKQRIAIARAFATGPDFVICDEATSSLDVTVQAGIMSLLAEMQNDTGASYLLISHDMGLVHAVSEDVVVLYLGQVCESGPREAVFSSPYHPYTEALLSAVSVPGREDYRPVVRLRGVSSGLGEVPSGCRFHPRCPRKLGPICAKQAPALRQVAPGHFIRCLISPDELRAVPDISL